MKNKFMKNSHEKRWKIKKNLSSLQGGNPSRDVIKKNCHVITWRGRMGETVNTHTHTHTHAHKHTQTQIYTYTYRGFREIAGTEKRFSSQEWC